LYVHLTHLDLLYIYPVGLPAVLNRFECK